MNRHLVMFTCALPVLLKSRVKVLSGRESAENVAHPSWVARALGIVQIVGRNEKRCKEKRGKAKPFARLEA